MEKKIITGIYLIPTSSTPQNPFRIADLIANQIGHLNCEIQDDTVVIKYESKLSNEHKERLDKIADNNCYALMYIEAYKDDERISYNTISLL